MSLELRALILRFFLHRTTANFFFSVAASSNLSPTKPYQGDLIKSNDSRDNLRSNNLFISFSFQLCRKIDRVICRAEFSQDAPLATAIGACILSSFVFPVAKRVSDEDEEDENSAIVSTDMRLAAMGIISFIPYFNWLVRLFFVFLI